MAPAELAEQVDKMSDQELQRRALGVIGREFGAYGLARFLRTYRSGRGDYTRDRHQWLDGVSVEELVAEARKLQ
jgi:hypothetical protein